MNWHHLFLGTRGRISRRDYWIGTAALFGAGMLAGAIPLVGAVAGLALVYPWLCLVAKRLHDLGRRGTLALIVAVLASASGALGVLASAALGAGFDLTDFALFASTLTSLAGLGFVLWAGLTEGDPGPNAYGRPPIVVAVEA